MSTVLSAVKLVGILVITLGYLIGLGWLLIGPLLNGSLIKKKQGTLLIQELPLLLLSGFILNFGILLVFQYIRISLIIGGILSLAGFIFFALHFFRYHLKKLNHPDSLNKWVFVGFISLLFISPFLINPLNAWDARSIWFFHAKMIYYAGSIGPSAGWQDASVVFSQVDYPKLVPVLAAQIMYVMGFWNEYLPKISLFFIMIPAIIWVSSFARRSISFLFLVIILPFSLHPWLWNGYMDGLLAFYFSIALLLFYRYLKNSEPIDLISSIACAIFLLYLKNEGILAVVALTFAGLLFFVIKRKPFSPGKLQKKIPIRYLVIGFTALIPFVIWWVYKAQWGLSNDLGLGSGGSIERLFDRLSDGSLRLIIETLFKYVNLSLNLLVILLISVLMFRRPIAKGSLFALIAVLIYIIGNLVIYLMTPHDLYWHITNSAVRVMELANAGINMASYLILASLEQDPVVLEARFIKHI